ncbi:MAG: hypothetical protein OQK51_06115 [Kangiellaceae bacterium]|nr:hypothetical protein [Kangiellaceae bacterium]
MLELVIIFIINLIFTTSFLWIGMKCMQVFTGVGWSGEFCSFKEIGIAAVAASAASIVPYIGTLLSFVVLLALLVKFTETSIKDVILMVIFARVASFVAVSLLAPLL